MRLDHELKNPLTAIRAGLANIEQADTVADTRSIRVTVPQAPWPLPLIEGNRDLLFVAMQNLAANAVKLSAAGDTVEIRASRVRRPGRA